MSTTTPPGPMHLHTTMTGHELRYAPRVEVDAFIARLRSLGADPAATERDMVALVYTTANPLLGPVPGDPVGERGYVTADVLADPAFRVMTDLVARKRFEEQGIDAAELAKTFTVSTAEAAARAGVSESAVRQAITAGRLASWVKEGGRHWLHPDGVARFRAQQEAGAAKGSRRGPKPSAPTAPLEVCVGHAEGRSFRVKYPGTLSGQERVEANFVTGVVPSWSRIAVLAGAAKARLFILEPAPSGTEPQEIAFDGGFVRGRYTIVETVNNPKRARDEFRDFTPA